MSPTLKPRFRQIAFRMGLALAGGFFIFLLLNTAFPFRFSIRYSQNVLAADSTVIKPFLAPGDKWRLQTALHETSPQLLRAVIHKEDRFFYFHPGINPFAVLRALGGNLWRGKKASGASTITMQLVRLLEPRPRTYTSKLVEMFRALQLEWGFSKDEILEMYLNLVPYGGNIEGIGSASLLYFNTVPAKLSLAQAVALAVIPNRPSSLAIGRHNPQIQEARDKWLHRFAREGVFGHDETAAALAEPIDAARRPAPDLAPHFALFARRNAFPGQANLRTTLVPETQEKTAQITQAYSRRLRPYNIHNAAVLVVENATREIVAYVGSPDFTDGAQAGQVDGVRAIRSPGSTLKPAVYALAFDLGACTPKTVTEDVAVDYDGYAPENFDRLFHGKVTIGAALAASLNTVAVNTLEKIGVPAFLQTAKMAGFAQIARDERKLGLSVALGGCGVSLYELAGLYAAFANGGQFKPLVFMQGKGQANGEQLFTEGATFMVTEILTQLERPDYPNNYHSTQVPKIAWKTGTSYGRRDAWAVGFNKKYTIAVWVGNFSGEGVRELTGAAVATPLLFRVFNALDHQPKDYWFGMPKTLKSRLVCAESGMSPSSHCSGQISDYFIPGVSPSQECTHLKTVFVSAGGELSYCGNCLPQNGYQRRQYPNLSPALASHYLKHGVPYEKIPPHNPTCLSVAESGPPKIVSPADGREYFMPEAGSELLLACHTGSEVHEVYWYINNRFHAKAQAGSKVFVVPPKGLVKISCADDLGRNTDVLVVVR